VLIDLEMTDSVSEKIRAFDTGILDDEDVDKLFQHLVDTGQVWQMAPRYGKTAQELAEVGRIRIPDFGLDTTYFFGP
jgi:hypothetical protein